MVRSFVAHRLPGAGELSIWRRRGAVPEIPGHPAEAPLSALPARPALGILADDRVCLWCNDSFEPRRSGGKQQAFCRPACRRAFDVAGRRWVAEAIAAGVLTVDALKSGPA